MLEALRLHPRRPRPLRVRLDRSAAHSMDFGLQDVHVLVTGTVFRSFSSTLELVLTYLAGL